MSFSGIDCRLPLTILALQISPDNRFWVKEGKMNCFKALIAIFRPKVMITSCLAVLFGLFIPLFDCAKAEQFQPRSPFFVNAAEAKPVEAANLGATNDPYTL
jgi:hypothetical protein